MKNEPKIRIKGFEGEWKKHPFSETFAFLRNNSLSRAELNYKGGLVKNVHYGDVLIKFGEIIDVNKEILPFISDNEISKRFIPNAILNEGDIVFSDAAEDETVGKCSEVLNVGKNMIVSGLHTVPCRPIIVFANCYLGFYLNSKAYHNQLLPLIQGTKISSLSKAAFLNTNVSYPNSISEQRAIATYFRHIDSLIETADKKLASLKQVKEASLQSMFPKEGQKVPEVRFKGFEGEWKTSKLSTFAKRVTRKNGNLETELPVTISSQDGIIAQTQFFNSVVASSNLRGYYLIKKGEFAYNKSYSNGYPYGSVKRLEKYDMGALSTLYIVFALSKDIDHDYVIYFFETMLWHNEVAMRAAEGARNHGLLNIGADDFLDIQIIVPPILSEQRKIASFFVHLDKQIAIAQQRLDLLRRIKDACLDEMFV